jgi:NitT/TauT family transport system substrate-binding protein
MTFSRPSLRAGALAGALAGAIALALFACGRHPEPLRVGLLVWPPFELPHVAAALGWLPERRVRLVDFRSPAELVRALERGQVDAATLTLDYLPRLAADPSTRIVFVVDQSVGGDALVAKPGIESLGALRGRRVALERGELGQRVFAAALAAAGMAPGDVTLVPVDVGDHVRAWEEERADAFVTYEPARTRLLALGGRELFSSREMSRPIVDVLVTRSEAVARHRRAFEELVAAWLRAAELLGRDSAGVARVAARRERLAPEAWLTTLRGVRLVSLAENRALLHARDTTLVAELRRLLTAHGATDAAAPRHLEPAIVESVAAR